MGLGPWMMNTTLLFIYLFLLILIIQIYLIIRISATDIKNWFAHKNKVNMNYFQYIFKVRIVWLSLNYIIHTLCYVWSFVPLTRLHFRRHSIYFRGVRAHTQARSHSCQQFWLNYKRTPFCEVSALHYKYNCGLRPLDYPAPARYVLHAVYLWNLKYRLICVGLLPFWTWSSFHLTG